MTVRNIKKNLAGAEDLLHGIGIESQSRGGAIYEMHKLDTYVPTYDVEEMKRSSLTFMRVYWTDTNYTDYRRNPVGTIGIASDLGGVWEVAGDSLKLRQLLAKQAAEAGFNLVDGSFEEGANISGWPDVVWCQTDGKYYQWHLDEAKTVSAGSTPATSGGIGAGAWVDRTDLTLRSELSTESGSSLIGTTNTSGETSDVSQELHARESASYRDRCIKNLAAVDYLVRSKGSFNVLCQGDSLTAGFDTTSTDTVPAENGDTARHATTIYPERLSSFLLEQSGATATPVIRAISGYTAKQAYEKAEWQNNPNCALALIMYGVNDASNDTQTNHNEYLDYMERHIKRFINWGAGVVVIAPAVGSYGQLTQAAQRYARQIKNLATIYGCAYFDGTEVHNNKEFSSVVSDGVHFNSQGYAILGESIASMMMAGGLLPSYKQISSEFTAWPGIGSDHIGYYNPLGTVNLSRNRAAYTLQKITGEFSGGTPTIASFSFYLDAESAEIDIVGSWQAKSGFQVAIHPTTVSQAGPNVTYYFPEGRSSNNAEIVNSTKYVASISNVNTLSGAPKHVGVISGRGWKTIAFYTPLDGTGVGSAFLMQLTIRPIPRYLASRQSSASIRRGITEMSAYSYPYRDYVPVGGGIPTALTLSSIVLPMPFDLYGVSFNPADQYLDCGFAKLYISGNHKNVGPVYYEAVIYRGSGGNTYSISEIKKIGDLGTVSVTCGTKARSTTVAKDSVGTNMPLEDIINIGDDSSFIAGAAPNEYGLFLNIKIDWTGQTVRSGWYTVYLQSFARGLGGASSIMGIML